MNDEYAQILEHLRAREEVLLDPMVRRDRGQVADLLADDFFEFGSSGRVWSRAATLDLLASEDYTPPSMEDFACHLIAPDVALVTYKSVRIDSVSGMRRVVLRSSLWIRKSERWRVRFHQGTKAARKDVYT
jgi:hypothetical protein